MKKIVFLLLLMLCALGAAAQDRKITGTLTDKDTHERMEQAAVQLLRQDSSYVKGSVTDANGAFSITAPNNGKYILKFSNVGYKTLYRNVNVSNDNNVDVGNIVFASSAIALKGTTVTANAAKVTLKKDTFIYNATAFRTPEGSTIEELVKRLPGAQVGDDGKITINGKEVKKIKVDGKEFMVGDTKTAMKNLPTNIVNRIKAYDEKSDLSRVTGIDDGNEQTVLDFGLKPGMNKGVFSNADLSTLSGQLAVGHVRYGTAGAKSWEASQPHLSTINSVIIALAHNGTLVNTDELRRQLIELGVPFLSNSDSEVATKLIGYFTQRTGHLREGIRKTMELVRGGYAMTLINEQALYAFRDPHGIRPLVLGKLVDEGLDQADAASVSQLPSQDGAATVDATTHVTRAGGWVVASETCALDIVGAEYVRDVRPGEILRISAEGLVSEQGVPAAEEPANCIFEQVYFARPDSIMNGKSVYACRYDMGRQLAHEEPVEADLVIGVPDSGLPPAEGYSHESGIPFGEGLIKNRYVGRTFIEPTQELRAMGVRMKLNPLRDNFVG